jgi:hypothetical protein
MSLRPKLPPKRDRSAEFTTFVPKPRAPAEVSPQLRAALDGTVASLFLPRPPAPKVQGRKRQDIRDSARGEECTIRLPGCDGGGETTVWCHLPEAVAGRGLALKGIDLLGAFGCRSCHDIVDRRAPRPGRMTEQDVSLTFYRALARSIVRLAQRGLI